MSADTQADYRQHFPGLATSANADWVFFDNAGGSHVLASAAARVNEYLLETPVQVGAGYAPSRQAAARVEKANHAMAALLNAKSDEIVFGPSSSALLSRLARALAPQFKPGDEIIVTDADHEANITPWRRLQEQGVVIRVWPVSTASWQLEVDDLRALLTPRTRMVCVTQASNILGQVTDIPPITRLVHEHGARVVVDGVAYVPHRLADVQALDADFYVFSGYKIFGPHIGVLYGKQAELLKLANLNHEYMTSDAIPAKLQPGSYSYELAYGMSAVTEYLEELGGAPGRDGLEAAWKIIRHHEQSLTQPILDFLAQKPGVTIIGPEKADAQRLPIIAFTAEGKDPAAIATACEQYKLGLRYGHFHAKRLTDRLGLTKHNGVVRISLAHYNTAEEVDRLLACLKDIL